MPELVHIGFAVASLAPLLPTDRPLHDAIEMRLMFLHDEDSEALWAVFDTMDLNAGAVQVLATTLAQMAKVAHSHVHILTTHNHGAPETAWWHAPAWPAIAREACQTARRNARPAWMRFGYMDVPEMLTLIRRIPVAEWGGTTTIYYGPHAADGYRVEEFIAGQHDQLQAGLLDYTIRKRDAHARERHAQAGDRRLAVLQIQSADGTSLGGIVRFAAHAVTCNRPEHYSGDFPVYLRQALDRSLGGNFLFLNGPCAEIAPGMLDKYAGVERKLGAKLAFYAMEALHQSHAEPVMTMRDERRLVELPVRAGLHPGAAETTGGKEPLPEPLVERKRALERELFFQLRPFLLEKLGGSHQFATVQLGALRLNEVVLLAFPGETFSATAAKVASSVSGISVVTATEHGRTLMYLPPAAEIDAGGYETVCRIGDRNAEAILEREAVSLLRDTIRISS